MSDLLWALTLWFVGCVFLFAGGVIVRLTDSESYARGKQDAQPLRASNGWFIGKGK